MNISLLILYIFIFIVIILAVTITVTSTVNYLTARETVILRNNDQCVVDETKLPHLNASNNICCYNGGNKTGAYYIETTTTNSVGTVASVKLSVIPTPTYYINVCREYCGGGYTQTNTGDIQCNGETSINGIQSTQANACVKLTAPRFSDGTPCRGSALPVAIVGNDLLYALHAKVNNVISQCTSVGPC